MRTIRSWWRDLFRRRVLDAELSEEIRYHLESALDIDAALLSPDVDFEHIARHTPLRLWRENL